MTIEVALFNDTRMVTVDDRTALMGGSFYMQPHLQPYSPLPLRWCFDQVIKYPKATLIDVGANTGSFTLMAKHHPGLTVHAFEPTELGFRVLNENIFLNDLQLQVTANRVAVGNYNGEATLHTIRDIGGLGVSMVNGSPAWHKAVDDSPVEMVTLDTYCAGRGIEPRFIKIDTEGAEKYVLEGSQAIIEKYHPFLLFEYSQENANQYGYAVHELVKMVEDWGYMWSAPEGQDLWCVHRDWENLT